MILVLRGNRMIQDIEPRKYHVEYKNISGEKKEFALVFKGELLLMKQPDEDDNKAEFLTFEDLGNLSGVEKIEHLQDNARYLFSIDENKYFLVSLGEEVMATLQGSESLAGYILKWQSGATFRTLGERWRGFVAITALQMYRWSLNRKYCGRCGKPTKHSETERAMVCVACGITEYPKISPAVIVGVVDGDKLLLTRYADRPFKKYGLIAGFGEVGETLEDTVRREVMEEVGLKVKDITYYKNQPWSFSDSLLVGFFARLEGDNTVTLLDGELAEGTWFKRGEIPINEEEIALTAEMIRYFDAGNDIFEIRRGV